MRPYKGFDLAIEAMRLLDKRYRLVIAGPVTDQEYLNKMQELARGLPSVTILPRRIDDHELVRWLAAADCVLLPYRAITGSAALLGAVTAHRGVVASDLPFFHDTLSLSPGTGVLCEREDARALAEGIHQFFLMPPSDRCIAAARLSAMHDWLQIVEPIASWLKANAG
jgi:glycosyltransferase involved in cell wall biosynthesis